MAAEISGNPRLENPNTVAVEKREDGTEAMTVQFQDSQHEEGIFWHVLSFFDTEKYGTPQRPALMLEYIGNSPYNPLPEEYILPGRTLLHTFDHQPTEEEINSIIPGEYVE